MTVVTTTASTGTRNNITPPRVPFLDERTGLISREWFMWLLNMFARANQGAEVAEVVDYLASAPLTLDSSDDIRAAAYAGSLLGPAPSAYQFPQVPDYVGPAPFCPEPVPVPKGLLLGQLICGLAVDQAVPNTNATVNFDVTAPLSFGPITRTGNTFTAAQVVRATFSVQCQLRQNTNNAITILWLVINGVAVQGSGSTIELSASGDSQVFSFAFGGQLNAGDTVQLHITCSANNGSTLEQTPAAGFKPSIPAVQLDVLSFSV